MCLGIPLEVIELIPSDRARVKTGGVSLEISLQLVSNVAVGDYVLVHAGFAIEVMDIDAADETLKLLDEMIKATDWE